MSAIPAYGILVDNIHPGEHVCCHRVTDGRDEGHAWWSYDRDVAERHADELRQRTTAEGVTFRVVQVN